MGHSLQLDSLDMAEQRLMLIDDNPDITDLLEQVGNAAGFMVCSVNDYEPIKETYREFNPTVIMLDLDLGVDAEMDLSESGYDGLDVLRYFSASGCQAKIIIVSGMSRRKRELTQNLGRELDLRVIGNISKPFDVDKVEEILRRLKD